MDISMFLDSFSWEVLFLLLSGVIIGIIGGALPGISSTTTAALMATFALTMGYREAVMFMAATQVGSTYGGSIAATVLNIPGTPASAATALEAYPMAMRGDAQKALSLNVCSSFVGNTLGALILLVVFPVTLSLVMYFGSWEMFWFSVFGLIICADLSRGDVKKGLFSACLGLIISFVGADPIYGAAGSRFTLGLRSLRDGIGLIPAMVGLYGLSEVFTTLTSGEIRSAKVNKSKLFTFDIVWKYKFTALKVAIVGFIIGAIPGVGANIASWVGYNQAYSASKNKDEFGHGAVEGLIGSETSNNACVPGTYAPLLALGIPGDGVTAVVLGVLTVKGVQTGVNFARNNPDFIYLLVLALLFAGVVFLFVGTFLCRPILKVLSAPLPIIMATVIALCTMGSFSNSSKESDIVIMFIFGIIGLLMNKGGVPIAPMVLGIVVGRDLVDSNFRRAILAGDGSLLPFFTRPTCIILILLLLLVCGKDFFAKFFRRKRQEAM